MSESIPYGLRRYPLALGLFGSAGLGFLGWASWVAEPTFVFPFGTLPPEGARLVLGAVGVLALAFAAMITYVKFVRRPAVELGDGWVKLPVGEFGLRVVELRAGEVSAIVDEATPGGWRVLRFVHRGQRIDVPSARLPDDAAYERVAGAIAALAR